MKTEQTLAIAGGDAFQRTRWLCLLAAMIICVCAGFGYAWSVIQSPIVAAHGWPDGQVALAYTMTVLCSTMAPLFLPPSSAGWEPAGASFWARCFLAAVCSVRV